MATVYKKIRKKRPPPVPAYLSNSALTQPPGFAPTAPVSPSNSPLYFFYPCLAFISCLRQCYHLTCSKILLGKDLEKTWKKKKKKKKFLLQQRCLPVSSKYAHCFHPAHSRLLLDRIHSLIIHYLALRQCLFQHRSKLLLCLKSTCSNPAARRAAVSTPFLLVPAPFPTPSLPVPLLVPTPSPDVQHLRLHLCPPSHLFRIHF